MPIKENKRNHDFEWEFEPNGTKQVPVTVPLRYHYTEEYGPTISMLDEYNNVGYSFPADMFIDVCEEIHRINNFHAKKKDNAVLQPVPPGIGLPTIGVGTGMFKTGIAKKNPIVPVIDEQDNIEQPVNGFESFTVPVKKREKAEDIIAERGESPEERARKREEVRNKASAKSIRKAVDNDQV